jgi:hypothetical protein
MIRVIALVVGLIVASPGLLQADDPPAGTWKVVIPGNENPLLWLIKLEKKDGKWVGRWIASSPQVPEVGIEDVAVNKDLLTFKIQLKTVSLRFEGRVPAGAKEPERIYGSVLLLRGDLNQAHLERTTLTSLDPLELDKEVLTMQSVGHEVLRAALNLLQNASAKKAKVEEVRAWADKAVKAADAHGPLWHREVMLLVAGVLANQDGYPAVALQYARQAERLMDEKDSPIDKRRILTVLSAALEKSGKNDEAKEVLTRRDKIQYVTIKKYAGRKAKSDRVVLVELFTGAQCPPCVAADLAFDGLEQTYRPSEAVLLQYHLHIPGPDPLTNPDTETRSSFYEVRSTPVILINGQQGPRGGGGFDVCQARYDSYTESINEMLEQSAKASIKLSAAQKGNRIDINADVSDLAEGKGDVRLRLALVEELVSYTGGNRLPTHHCVVRAFAGGPAGFALKEKSSTKSASIDVEDLRKKLSEYLDKYNKDDMFPSKDRPLEMKRLRVVAFVQNNDTKEVYQAAQVPVTQE